MSKNKLFDNVFIMKEDINYPNDLDKRSYAVLYPTDGYYLSKEQHNIIQKSLNELGLIEEVLGTDIEFIQEDDEINNEEVREIPNFDYSIYKKDMLLFENCIYDSEFKWSISIFQDYWAVIYGSKELIDKISLNYDLKADLKKFNDEVIIDISNKKVKENCIKLLNCSYIHK